MKTTFFDVIVVGGGAIGCMTAWRIAQTGQSVLLLEKGQLGQEASRAAAGMLGAQLEVHEAGPFFHLCLQSRRLFRSLAEELLDITGMDIQLVPNGILHLAKSAIQANRLQARCTWQVANGGHAVWWSAAEVSQRTSGIATHYGGLFLPEDGNLSAPHYVDALAAAVRQSCSVVEGTEVLNIREDSALETQVETTDMTYTATTVVVCAGAWAEALLRPLGYSYHVRPVKGQMLRLRPQQQLPALSLRQTLFTEDVYIVPKRDGSVIVGATEEHNAGYDRAVTAGALSTLIMAAQAVVPALGDATFVEAWTGLRPRVASGLPIIGRLPQHPQIIVCAGHFRNGILLSPITAELVVTTLNGQPELEIGTEFSP